MKTEEEIRQSTGDRADGDGVRARSSSTAVEIDLDLEEAWEHRAELTEICRRIVGDPAIAEDVVQETYLQAFRYRHKLEQRDGLMPWLVTVAKRRSLNELRRHRYSTPVEEVPERHVDPADDPAATVAIGDELDRVTSILGTLTDRERELLSRQVYEGATLAELADDENSTPASVRSVLSRARSKIKAAVKESAAHVLAPIAVTADWVRDHMSSIHDRFNQTAPVLPAGQEKLTEILVAAGAGIALLLSTTLPGSPQGPATPPTVDTVPDPGELLAMPSGPVAGVGGAGVSDAVVAAYEAAVATSEAEAAPTGSSTTTGESFDEPSSPLALPEAPQGDDDDPLADPLPGDDPELPPAPDPGSVLDPKDDEDDGDGSDGPSTGQPVPVSQDDIPSFPDDLDNPDTTPADEAVEELTEPLP